jgi:hypothetical protein
MGPEKRQKLDLSISAIHEEKKHIIKPLFPDNDIEVSLVKVEVLNTSALPKPRVNKRDKVKSAVYNESNVKKRERSNEKIEHKERN